MTVAGVRPDRVPANGAGRLDALYGIATTASGELLISQPGSIVAVASDGSARVVAGTGRPGFNGDRSAPLQTQLDHPTQLAVTPAGSLVIADTANDRLREVGPFGALVTVAGSDRPGLRLAPVPRAPFATREFGGEGGHSGGQSQTIRRRGRYRTRGHVVQVRRAPLCSVMTTRSGYLKIRPYTATVVQSARRPAVIRFGVVFDAMVTAYAWRNARHYGELTRAFRRRARGGFPCAEGCASGPTTPSCWPSAAPTWHVTRGGSGSRADGDTVPAPERFRRDEETEASAGGKRDGKPGVRDSVRTGRAPRRRHRPVLRPRAPVPPRPARHRRR